MGCPCYVHDIRVRLDRRNRRYEIPHRPLDFWVQVRRLFNALFGYVLPTGFVGDPGEDTLRVMEQDDLIQYCENVMVFNLHQVRAQFTYDTGTLTISVIQRDREGNHVVSFQHEQIYEMLDGSEIEQLMMTVDDFITRSRNRVAVMYMDFYRDTEHKVTYLNSFKGLEFFLMEFMVREPLMDGRN